MIPLYTEAELSKANSRDLLPLECKGCSRRFLKPKNNILSSLSGHKRFKMDFCSNRCQRMYESPPITVVCSQCKKRFTKEPKEVKKSKSGNHFCSRSCAAKWNNAHKKHGTRRSKLEKWLEEQLTNLYPNLEFHFNRKDAIGSELDIFIPSLRLAFELNGIYHYEPIHGQDKLDAVQSNDRRKFAACHEAGISLCSIDTSSMNYFKPKKAERFLAIIQKIIESSTSG